MSEWISSGNLQQLWLQIQDWIHSQVLVPENLAQAVVTIGLYLLSRLYSRKLSAMLTQRVTVAALKRSAEAISQLSLTLPWLVLQWLAVLIGASAGLPVGLLEIVAILLSAWVVIRLVSRLVQDPLLARTVSWTAWTIAALNIVGLLTPAVEIMDSVAITLGGVRISPYTVVKSTLALALLLWVAFAASSVFESRIRSSRSLSPSLQVLMSKSLKMVLITLAVVIAIRSVGIDLTALTVLGGAIGLGIGFGLQQIIANLISGLILLVDKSIKPGDVISVEGTYGWVNTLGARYVSVITRGGTEHLIPNATLITNRVENWTHSDNRVRLKVSVGVHYQSDVHKVIELCVEACRNTSRVLDNPLPTCLLRGFGDNSVDLEVRFWIEDAANGIANVTSDVLLKIWDSFHQHGIEIPYPQRDLHIRSPQVLVDKLGQIG